MRFHLLFAAGLLLATTVIAQAQVKSISHTDPANPIRPFRTVKVTGPVTIDPRRFSPIIGQAFPPTHEMPENPTPALARDLRAEENTLPLGGMLDQARGQGRAFFPGISATGWYPADPTIAVGPNNVVETVNSSMAFYSKTGTLQLQQTAQNFFMALGATSFQFDPRVIYDRLAQRFVVLFDEEDDASSTSKILIAISSTSDPNGTWKAYRVEAKMTTTGSNAWSYWLDYPSLGYNKDGYVICGNMFAFPGAPTSVPDFGGTQFVVLPKAPMLTASPVTASYLLDPGSGSAQLSDTFDPNVASLYGASVISTASLRIYAISGIAATPGLNFTSLSIPGFTQQTSPATSKPGTLDTLDARLFSATFRNGHLFASHNVRASNLTQVRWYDIALNSYPFAIPSVSQSGNVVPGASQHFHMGAVGSNGYSDISAIFTRSSSSIPADAMFAGRHSTDTVGAMGTPVLLESSAGANYQSSSTNRWGDYFRCVVDPVDDATFWGVAMTGTASGDWRADVYSWTITPPANLSATSLPATIQGGTVGTGTITLDSVAPQAGYVVSLTSSSPTIASVPATVTVPGGASTVNYPVTTTTVGADTSVTITATLRGVVKTGSTTVLAPRLSGTVTLGDLSVSPAGQQVTVEVRNVGSTTPLDSYTATLDASGAFTVITTRTGTFDVAVKGSHWLRKVTSAVSFTNPGATFSVTLANGDVSGDNAVTLGDFAQLRAAYGSSPGNSNWNVNADLNGDGAVTLGDFAILRAHYGMMGDN